MCLDYLPGDDEDILSTTSLFRCSKLTWEIKGMSLRHIAAIIADFCHTKSTMLHDRICAFRAISASTIQVDHRCSAPDLMYRVLSRLDEGISNCEYTVRKVARNLGVQLHDEDSKMDQTMQLVRSSGVTRIEVVGPSSIAMNGSRSASAWVCILRGLWKINQT